MSEKKKYLLTRELLCMIISAASAEAQGMKDAEGLADELLAKHEYHEHTCHNVSDSINIFKCSYCWVSSETYHVRDTRELKHPIFCPHCGAKVVEE